MIETRNPTTGELIRQYACMSTDDVDDILQQAHTAYLQWRQTPLTSRAEALRKVAELLAERQEEFACLMADEMGKPLAAGRAEIEKCQRVCHYYADQGATQLTPRQIDTEFHKSYVSYEPLGVVFAIMPWNFPFWQVFRFAAPNTMLGNATVLSHAPISTGTALVIEEVFHAAGFPVGLFRSLIVDNDSAEFVIRHPQVVGVTLTGSEQAGRAVATVAGSALKKVVLELGGIDPYVILADADLDLAAEQIVKSRLLNTGQVCIAAKRIIAVDAIHDDLLQRVMTWLNQYHRGDPHDESVNLGPMARSDLRDTLHRQVQVAIEQGALLHAGGEMPSGPGFFYPPTVLSGLTAEMSANNEELFGPAIAFFRVANEYEAMALANDSSYGLSAAIFTEDIAHGEQLAQKTMQTGCCFVNGCVMSDPRLPFGGIKLSGYGRELSLEGIHAFANVKTVVVSG